MPEDIENPSAAPPATPDAEAARFAASGYSRPASEPTYEDISQVAGMWDDLMHKRHRRIDREEASTKGKTVRKKNKDGVFELVQLPVIPRIVAGMDAVADFQRAERMSKMVLDRFLRAFEPREWWPEFYFKTPPTDDQDFEYLEIRVKLFHHVYSHVRRAHYQTVARGILDQRAAVAGIAERREPVARVEHPASVFVDPLKRIGDTAEAASARRMGVVPAARTEDEG